MQTSPLELLERYYPAGSDSHRILVTHSLQVAEKACSIALRLGLDDAEVTFIQEAALLHDIGIGRTSAPDIGCLGELPYLAHGIEGRTILETAGLPRHALVCERHIGVGLSAAEIRKQNLPLPQRDMIPQTLAEQIVTYADLFFSKNPKRLDVEKPIETIRAGLARFGEDKVAIFDRWHARFAG